MTEQRRFDLELARERERSKIVQTLTKMGSWEFSFAEAQFHLSDEAHRILEVDNSAVTLGNLLSLLDLKDRSAVAAAFDASLATCEITTTEFRLILADARVKHINATWQVFPGSEESAFYAIGAFQDMSERHEANEKLLQSEQILRQSRVHLAIAQRLASVGSAAIDFRTGKWDWSDENFRIYGLEPGAIAPAAETLAALVHPEDRAALLSSIPLARSGQTPAPLEYRIVRPDGAERLLRREAALVYDEVGNVIGVVGAVQDVTELRAAQLAKKDSEDKLKEQAVMLSDAQRLGRMGSWSFNVQENKLVWSDATYELFGITPDQFRGTSEHFRSFILPEDLSVCREANERATPAAPHLEAQYRIRRPDGQVRWMLERGSVLFDESGNPVRKMGMVSDVTELRNLEAQLRDAMRMDVIGQLTGGVAHDFNNLLSVVLGSAETLMAELNPDDPCYPAARLIMRAAERGSTLTGRLLAFARRQPLAPKITDINKLLNGMQALLRRTIEGDIDIAWNCDPGLSHVLIDPPQLENVILNLCLNARDAMPHGGRITIRTRNINPDNLTDRTQAFICIAVTDTGTGMDQDTLAHVFEPFFTTKGVGKGSGLGLSMVHGFITQSNGHIDIDSKLGGGTTVNLLLPMAVGEPEVDIYTQKNSLLAGNREKILLVEDDPMVRKHVRGMLERLNYQVTDTVNAKSALKTLETQSDFALLLTDIVLPGGMNGRKLAEVARERLPGLAILLSTGYAQELLNRNIGENGAFLLLKKPYRARELATMVHRALETGAEAIKSR